VSKFKELDKDFDYLCNEFEVTDADLDNLLELSKEKGFEYPRNLLESDSEFIKIIIKAELAQLLWSNRDYYYIIRTNSDPVVSKAMELFDEAREIASVWR